MEFSGSLEFLGLKILFFQNTKTCMVKTFDYLKRFNFLVNNNTIMDKTYHLSRNRIFVLL